MLGPSDAYDVLDTKHEFDVKRFRGIHAWLDAKRYAKKMNNLTEPIPEPNSRPAAFDEQRSHDLERDDHRPAE